MVEAGFVGHQSHTSSVIGLTPDSVVYDQCAKRLPPEQRWPIAEWDKLKGISAFRTGTVRPRADVEREAKAKNKTAHFGDLMELCHEKHSELPKHLRTYKGRVVFRGDQVRDEKLRVLRANRDAPVLEPCVLRHDRDNESYSTSHH